MSKSLPGGVLLLLITLFSCSKGDFDINLNGGTGTQQALLVDSMRIEMATVKSDSIVSSASGILLVGSLKKPESFEVSSEAYFQLDLPATSFRSLNITDSIVVDSAQVLLQYANATGDTTNMQQFAVHEVLETMPLHRSYTIGSSFKHTDEASGTTLHRARPSRDTSIVIPVDKKLATRLFDYYRNIQSGDTPDLTRVLKGLLLKGGENNTCLYALTAANSVLRIYTHIEQPFARSSYDFKVVVNNAQFNHFDYASTFKALGNLTKRANEVPSSQTANAVLLNSGLGFAGKLTIPGIENLKLQTNLNGIFKAELRLYSTRRNARELPIPPQNLALYLLNLSNEVVATLPSATGAPVAGMYQTLPDALVFKSFYSFDLTQYFKDVLAGRTRNREILIQPVAGSVSSTILSGLMLGDQQNEPFEAELRVYINK